MYPCVNKYIFPWSLITFSLLITITLITLFNSFKGFPCFLYLVFCILFLETYKNPNKQYWDPSNLRKIYIYKKKWFLSKGLETNKKKTLKKNWLNYLYFFISITKNTLATQSVLSHGAMFISRYDDSKITMDSNRDGTHFVVVVLNSFF